VNYEELFKERKKTDFISNVMRPLHILQNLLKPFPAFNERLSCVS